MTTIEASGLGLGPIPLVGPVGSGRVVLELVRANAICSLGGATTQVIVGIHAIPGDTIWEVKPGFKSEYRYFQSIGGRLVQAFKSRDLLII